MKKFVAICSMLALLLGTTGTAMAVSSENETIPNEDETVLDLEYMDYINNQAYYDALVMDEGYTLYVQVGEEYKEQEKERLAQNAEADSELLPPLTRGVDVPTSVYNLSTTKSKYTFRGTGPVHTNYMFSGQTLYKISVYNSNSGNLTVQVYNAAISKDYADYSFEVPGGTTVVSRENTESSTDNVYLFFIQNMSFNGYIGGYLAS